MQAVPTPGTPLKRRWPTMAFAVFLIPIILICLFSVGSLERKKNIASNRFDEMNREFQADRVWREAVPTVAMSAARREVLFVYHNGYTKIPVEKILGWERELRQHVGVVMVTTADLQTPVIQVTTANHADAYSLTAALSALEHC